MSRSITARLRRLEAKANPQESGMVVIHYREEADADAQIADLKACGFIQERDLVVCIRLFGDGPTAPFTPTRMCQGRTVLLSDWSEGMASR